MWIGTCVLVCLIFFVTLCELPSTELCGCYGAISTFDECCMKDLLAVLRKIVSQWYNV
jgi:hypothetical protein